MYFKVIKNNRVIDVLDKITYLRWQPKHSVMVLSSEDEAQAILSSDKDSIWHVDGLYNIPVDGYDTVELAEIDEYEYNQLKLLNCKTPEEIIDNFVLSLFEKGVI